MAELVTWNQLTGVRRLCDAPAEWDERGWDALPLAAKELCRLFPQLWGSARPPNVGSPKTPGGI